MQRYLRFFNTIRFKLIGGILAFLLPVIALLIYSSFYAIRVTQNQVAESYRDMIALYMGQIDDRLSEVDNYLYKLAGLDDDIRSIQEIIDDSEYMLAKVRIYIRMSRDILIYDIAESFFVYSNTHDDFIQVFEGSVSISERTAVNRYIRRIANEGLNEQYINSRSWHTQILDGQYYLFNILKVGDIYIGAWTRIENLKMDISLITIGEKGASFFINEKAQPMTSNPIILGSGIELRKNLDEHYFSGTNNQYLVIGERSRRGDFSKVAIIELTTILESLPFIQIIIYWISVGFIILVPFYLLLLRKTILLPLRNMEVVMKKIHEGDLDERIEIHPIDQELKVVTDTFNNMMKQIKELKISVYEEKIIRQNTELMYLQMQVNPHFFLNTLNILYSLARTKKYGLIQEMTLCLIKYFRYMFKKDSAFVSLGEELQHVKNYISIQRIRFPNRVSCDINVPDFLLEATVPALIILMFVENSIKYAMSDENNVTIEIDIDIESVHNHPYLVIKIQDHGLGFSDEVLSKLQTEQFIGEGKGYQIGIWNVQRRLKMLYEGKSSIAFSNRKTGGACVTIKIPFD